MGNRTLNPDEGWEHDELNLAISSEIFAAFSPMVNDGVWSYMNFSAGSGIFEDEDGFSVTLEFDVPEEGGEDIKYLNFLCYSYPDDQDSFILKTMLRIEKKFQLIRVVESHYN